MYLLKKIFISHSLIIMSPLLTFDVNGWVLNKGELRNNEQWIPKSWRQNEDGYFSPIFRASGVCTFPKNK